ncbi:MAG TPA: magnesium transporter CorA family protein [Aliidongia sp.]|uniref:magnesium transporter CorA family protein n=1 Tax=Aliidongia sp. TaxID=1914230 RepID=UPI002DDCA066|nr:magnesium transporter CorA family protein [Aliidongia sp.]HEV2678276.1 magnesium transporter CorA family protein [Aliidongia sp.]
MLALQTRDLALHETVDDLVAATLPPDVIWIDMCSPTPDEIAFVERVTKLTVPSRADVSEIETSSRLNIENGVLYLSTPISFRADGSRPSATPVGFVLAPHLLITVRFEDLPAFSTFKQRCFAGHDVHPSSGGLFIGLLETVVDRMADVLEHVGAELDAVSHRVFRPAKGETEGDADLRATLQSLGQGGELLSKIRDSLLGIGRIVPFVTGLSTDWMPADVGTHLKTLRDDVASLSDYDSYLNTKVQFLLDATLGLINIEQNNIMKVLTVVSVVGMPPVLIAGIYGMNFKVIPELDWAFGYPYAIGLMVVSAIIPLIWLKRRRWF